MTDNRDRQFRRLLAAIDARLLEAMTSTEDLPDEALREIAMLETARSAVVRVMSQPDLEQRRARVA